MINERLNDKVKNLIKEVCDEYAFRAVEAEDMGEFPGSLIATVRCSNGKTIKFICQADCITQYGCNLTMLEGNKELLTIYEGKYIGSLAEVNAKLTTTISGINYHTTY